MYNYQSRKDKMTSNHRYTFGNGIAGQKLETIVRHYYDYPLILKRGLCGEPMGDYPIFHSKSVAVRIQKATICSECENLA